MRDFTVAVRQVGFLAFCKRVFKEIFDDQIFTLASALSYSWLFAAFPFMLFTLSLAPLLPAGAKSELKERMGPSLQQVLPDQAYKTIWENFLAKPEAGPGSPTKLDKLLDQPRAGFMSLGAILAIWGASGGVAMTMTALDKCYDIQKARKFVHQRGIAMLLTIVTTIMILSVFVLLPLCSLGINLFIEYAARANINVNFALLGIVLVARYVIATLLCLVTLAVLYHFGTAARTRWHWLTPGSLFTLLVWIGLALVFRLYVNTYGKYEQTYGAVGGVVILLLFFYLDAAVLLIGAEIDSEINYIAHNAPEGTIDFTGEPWQHLKQREGIRTDAEV